MRARNIRSYTYNSRLNFGSRVACISFGLALPVRNTRGGTDSLWATDNPIGIAQNTILSAFLEVHVQEIGLNRFETRIADPRVNPHGTLHYPGTSSRNIINAVKNLN